MKDKKTLNELIKEINKQHGENTISFINEDDIRAKVNWISSGCFSIDRVMGGGLPMGRIIEIYGAPSGGKSSMALFIVSQIQKNGGQAAYVDAEFSFTKEYADKIGVDTEKLLLVQPDCGEDALDVVVKLIGNVDIIVVDSTAALVPKKELEGDITDSTVAVQARLISKGLRMITGVSSKSNTIVVFISQIRDKIGGFGGGFTGPSTDATGGKALKFYSSIRLEVSKIQGIKKGDEVIGNKLRIKATKNKVGMPFRTADIDLYFEKGIDVVGDLFDVAVAGLPVAVACWMAERKTDGL